MEAPLLSPELIAELRRIELRTRRTATAELLGQYRSAFRGTGLSFAELREYVPGDEMKSIHWKATARRGKVYVKSYEEERQLQILVAVDMSRSTLYGSKSKHQKSIEFAALVSMLAKQSGDALGLCTFSGEVEEYMQPERKRGQFRRVLYSLAEQRTLSPQTSIENALQKINERLKKSTIVFLVSDFCDNGFEQSFRRLAFKHDLVTVFLEDTLDTALPCSGILEFEDAETGSRIEIDAGSATIQNKLQMQFSDHMLQIKKLCRESGSDLITVNDDPLKSLRDLIRLRNRELR